MEDIGELKESLAALSAALPELPGKLSALRGECETAEGAVHALLKDLADKRDGVSALLREVRHGLWEVRDEAVGSPAPLAARLDFLDGAIEASIKVLESRAGELGAGVDLVVESADQVRGHVAEAGTRATEEEQESGRALHEVTGALQAGQDDLGSALNAVSLECEGLRVVVDGARRSIDEALGALRDEMWGTLERARQQVGETVQELSRLQGELEDQLVDEGASLDTETGALQDTLRQAAEQEVQGPARVSIEEVASAIGGLSRVLTLTRDALQGWRPDGEALSAALSEAIQPLPAAIESVKQAATDVGLPWS